MTGAHVGRTVRLGKKEPRVLPGTLRLSAYLKTAELPEPKPEVNWNEDVRDLGMLLNDQLGCCTCATLGHMIKTFNAANGRQVTIPDAEVLKAYKKIGGYVEGDPSTDNGAYAIDALVYGRDVGFKDTRGKLHKLLGFASVDLKNQTHAKLGIDWFGGVYFGLGLPVSAQQQDRWRVMLGGDGAEVGSWGGHATSAHRYDRDGLVFTTWGGFTAATWNWHDAYADEGYVVVTEDWADADGAPSGLDKAALLRDLRALS